MSHTNEPTWPVRVVPREPGARCAACFDIESFSCSDCGRRGKSYDEVQLSKARLACEEQDLALLLVALDGAPRDAQCGVWRVEHIWREAVARVSRGPFHVKVATEPRDRWPESLAAAIKALQKEPVDACW